MAALKAFPAPITCGLIPFAFPNLPMVRCCFGTALYGNIGLDTGLHGEADKQRRRKLGELMGFREWTELKQVHGNRMLANPQATPWDAPSTLEADASCTGRAGHALIVKSADCQQILLAHASGQYVAAIHAGWRGNALNFPATAVRDFCATYSIKPQDVMAVRGPSLGPGAAEFVNFDKEWPTEYTPWFDRNFRTMDLWSLTRHQLESAGLLPCHIFGLDLCTHSLDMLFYSHRRGHQGRQGAIIFIAE